MEAQKIKKCDLPTNNAENWYHDYTGKKGKIVKLGSVIVWKKGKIHFSKDGAGHVAYVECVYPDGSIDTSESAYGGKRWYTKHYNKKYTKTGYQFEGFIYPDERSLKLLNHATEVLHENLNKLMKTKVTFGEIKNITRSTIGQILFEHTNRTPMIIPIIMNKQEGKI